MSKKQKVLPGFGLSLGITIFYLGIVVLLPLAALGMKAFSGGASAFLDAAFDPRSIASYKISFGASLAAALVNALFGLLLAYVLVRYEFPGRAVLDALVDMPFALPTAVSGIALTSVYAPTGVFGSAFARVGIKTAYSPVGIFIALVFIGLPFVVRTIQPVLEEVDHEMEEAAASLGASRFQVFVKIIFPEILPALLIGTSLAFARAVGEYGSVVFIAGNMPFQTEITPLLIITKLEQYDYAGAATLGIVMLSASLLILLIVSALERLTGRHEA